MWRFAVRDLAVRTGDRGFLLLLSLSPQHLSLAYE